MRKSLSRKKIETGDGSFIMILIVYAVDEALENDTVHAVDDSDAKLRAKMNECSGVQNEDGGIIGFLFLEKWILKLIIKNKKKIEY